TYDGNGNMSSGDGRSIAWTSFNKPTSISSPSVSLNYSYDAGFDRFKTVRSNCTDYLGNSSTNCIKYEINPGMRGVQSEIETTCKITSKRSYVYAGVNNVVAIHTTRSDGTSNLRFLHRDHQGTVNVVSDESGAVVERLSYDTYGKRRNVDGTEDSTNS